MARPKLSTIILSSLLAVTSIFSIGSSNKAENMQRELNQVTAQNVKWEKDYKELEDDYSDLLEIQSKYRAMEEKYNRISEQYADAQDRCKYYENQIIDLKEELKDSQRQTVVTNLIGNNNNQSQSTQNRSSPQLNSKPSQSSSSGSSRTIPYKENYHGHVYRTKTGECYHYESPCGRGNYFECSWDDVDRLGLRACEKCVMH